MSFHSNELQFSKDIDDLVTILDNIHYFSNYVEWKLEMNLNYFTAKKKRFLIWFGLSCDVNYNFIFEFDHEEAK